jgi:hypothetical protein
MRAVKQHSIEPDYSSLHHCLEAHFGDKHSATGRSHCKYREAEQGPRTVLFQSSYPLQLDYMRRRKNSSLFRKLFSNT